MSRYRFIEEHRTSYPVRRLCQVLAKAPSRYYAWQQRQKHVDALPALAWEVALDQTVAAHKKRYGTRQLRVQPCVAGAYALCTQRPTHPALPTRPTACAVPPTACSTSPLSGKLTACG